MTPNQKHELWRWAVHSRVFDINHMLGNVHSTLVALAGVSHERVAIEAQLLNVTQEAAKLRDMLSHFAYTPYELPKGVAATTSNLKAFIKQLFKEAGKKPNSPKTKPKLDAVWNEFLRLQSIYVFADDAKKFYLAAEAYRTNS